MKYILAFFASLFTAYSSLGQVDTNTLRKFIEIQTQVNSALENEEYDKCLSFLSPKVIREFGRKSLQFEMKRLNLHFKKFPNPETTVQVGLASDGVGAFGHDVSGSFEVKVICRFYDSAKKSVYWYSIVFDDSQPTYLIKSCDSKAYSEVRKLEREAQSK